jgi:hypothetical protein
MPALCFGQKRMINGMKALVCVSALALMAFATAVPAQQTRNDAANQSGIQLVQVRTVDDVILQLQAAGFTIDEVTRTLLGRIRVLASNQTTTREIVMSRATGEILSDVVRRRDPAQRDTSGRSDAGVAAQNGVAAGDTGSTASGGRSSDARSTGRGSSNSGAGGANRSQ